MNRRAFTLLELLLALGLTVIVVSAISAAVYQYIFFLTKQQTEIERKQIARGVVRMINEDFRAAIQYKPQDYSGLENLIASQSLSGIGGLATGADLENIDADALEQDILDAVASGGGSDGQSESPDSGAGGPDTQSSSADESDEESDEETADEEELGRPTMIGNEYVVRIDTSRLPRLDEYNPLIARRETEDRLPSDIKTVTYFFSESAPLIQDRLQPEFGRTGGLYRRQVDRAVEAFRGDEDISATPDQYCDLVSPEVQAVKFRYWNGEEWRSTWDSEEEGGFPLAIEVQIVIDPDRAKTNSNANAPNEEELELHRTVIHLPVAEVPEEEEATE